MNYFATDIDGQLGYDVMNELQKCDKLTARIRLSIIIVTYNNMEDIVNCLESINKYNEVPDEVEIIIVDNSDKLELYNFVYEKYKWVKIIKSKNNGFGSGNNIGASAAKGDLLLFLNPDTIIIEPIFEKIIYRFDNNADMVSCGVKLIDKEGKSNYSFQYVDRYGVVYNQMIKIFNKANFFQRKKMFIMGADIFIRKSVFDEVGKFDKKIFMYFEESDLTHRLFDAGKDGVFFFSDLHIIHLEGKNNKSIENYLSRLQIHCQSEEYYCEKHSLNFRKRMKKRIGYENLKYCIMKIFHFQPEKIEYQRKIASFYSSYLS